MNITRCLSATLAAACVCVATAEAMASLKLPAIFSPGMVLQQNSVVPIWGWATPGERIEIRVSWSQTKSVGRTGDDGKWRIPIRVPAAVTVDGPQVIFILGDTRQQISDVLIGEVWLCSGQSNMEMLVGDVPGMLGGVTDWQKEIESADLPDIRLFNVPNAVSALPLDDCAGSWSRCSPETAKSFSATAYFFGREIHKRMNVPVGLITADWGGTPIQAWTSLDGIRAQEHLSPWVEVLDRMRNSPAALKRDHDAAVAAWRADLDARDRGVGGGWMKPVIDDSSWATIDAPGAWRGELAPFDGIIWTRRAFTASADAAGKPGVVELGPIDDFDETWINGVKVGEHFEPGSHTVNRSYEIPGGVIREGANTVAVRIMDIVADGGMCGSPDSLRVRLGDGSPPVSLAGQWRWSIGAPLSSLPARPRLPQPGPGVPTMLYNGMIASVAGYGIRGVTWYQGESNRAEAFAYRGMFRTMIEDWRQVWGRGAMPFYFVQIAPFNYGNDRGETAELREAQASALALPNTGMAVTMDIGDPADIHPRNKQEVGRRLALCALADTYKQSVEFSGPVYKSMEVANGSVRLTFTHALGLAPADEPLTCFTIAGADRKFVPAEARIDGESVIVRSDAVPAPVAVRFGWGAADQPNLRNAAGLPAPPFRTDDWPGVTQPGK